jgi:hypothetical protein
MLPLVKIYKGLYGETGLSSHLWAMESSELQNYIQIYNTEGIGLSELMFLEAYSLLKYLRRLVIVGAKKMVVYLAT